MLDVRQVARHLSSWHLISVILLHHPQSRCASLPSQRSGHPASLSNSVDIIGPLLPHLFLLLWRFFGGSVNTCFTCIFFSFSFLFCLLMHSTLGVSGTGTRLGLIERLLLEPH